MRTLSKDNKRKKNKNKKGRGSNSTRRRAATKIQEFTRKKQKIKKAKQKKAATKIQTRTRGNKTRRTEKQGLLFKNLPEDLQKKIQIPILKERIRYKNELLQNLLAYKIILLDINYYLNINDTEYISEIEELEHKPVLEFEKRKSVEYENKVNTLEENIRRHFLVEFELAQQNNNQALTDYLEETGLV